MTLWARIIDGRVIEVFEHPTNPKPLFDPSWTWFPCPDGTVGNATVTDGVYTNPPTSPPIEPPTPVEVARAEKLAAISAKVSALLEAGSPFLVDNGATLHIALDDGSRADLTAMATTAIAAAAETIPWPASYALGWIATENIRIPLAAPEDGLLLAASVGDHYARIRQNGRTLKDAVIAAVELAALDAIDIESGWPE